MEEISLENKANKYDLLKEFIDNKIPLINQKLDEINLILEEINPVVNITKTRRKINKGLSTININNIIYNELREEKITDITTEEIGNRFNISKTASNTVTKLLRKRKDIQTRYEGKKIILYYFKSKQLEKDVEIFPDVKIQKITEIMRWKNGNR